MQLMKNTFEEFEIERFRRKQNIGSKWILDLIYCPSNNLNLPEDVFIWQVGPDYLM